MNQHLKRITSWLVSNKPSLDVSETKDLHTPIYNIAVLQT